MHDQRPPFWIRHAANMLTISRMVFSLCLLMVAPLSGWFYAFYLLCGLSDMVDGWVARRTQTESALGATLDSISDALFVFAALVALAPAIHLEGWMWWWLGGIAAVKVGTLVIGFVKYRAFAFLHTFANKAAGALLFAFPLLYGLIGLRATAWLLCAFCSVAAVEELWITLRAKVLASNIRSAMSLRKGETIK